MSKSEKPEPNPTAAEVRDWWQRTHPEEAKARREGEARRDATEARATEAVLAAALRACLHHHGPLVVEEEQAGAVVTCACAGPHLGDPDFDLRSYRFTRAGHVEHLALHIEHTLATGLDTLEPEGDEAP